MSCRLEIHDAATLKCQTWVKRSFIWAKIQNFIMLFQFSKFSSVYSTIVTISRVTVKQGFKINKLITWNVSLALLTSEFFQEIKNLCLTDNHFTKYFIVSRFKSLNSYANSWTPMPTESILIIFSITDSAVIKRMLFSLRVFKKIYFKVVMLSHCLSTFFY